MYQQIETPTPSRPMDTYTVSTPYGTVTISDGGRKVTFELYSDIRQSRHNQALFAYLQQLIKQGITRYNTDHLNLAGRDKSLSLARGKSRLDLVYIQRGKTYECELKTSREIGLDVTARQLEEMVKYCERLIVLVPRGCLEEMATILTMINLDHQVAVQPYDSFEDD
ncbi:hypothetical protein ES703_98681 [subsurface metagenome]